MEEQYNSILETLADNATSKVMQINYYYDTEDYMLFKNDETLRIRQIDNCLKLQFKYNKYIENDIRVSKESCEEINILPKKIIANEMFTQYIGFLMTERLIIGFNPYTVFIDKNYYLGKVDYEIEIEAKSISNIPRELFGIQLNGICEGKYARFIRELSKQIDIFKIPK